MGGREEGMKQSQRGRKEEMFEGGGGGRGGGKVGLRRRKLTRERKVGKQPRKKSRKR